MNLFLAEILIKFDYRSSFIKKLDGWTWDKVFVTDKNLHLAVDFYPDGNLQFIRFYKASLLHRPHTEGPAAINFSENGNIEDQQFWECGRVIK
jgi:hypothetical protein